MLTSGGPRPFVGRGWTSRPAGRQQTRKRPYSDSSIVKRPSIVLQCAASGSATLHLKPKPAQPCCSKANLCSGPPPVQPPPWPVPPRYVAQVFTCTSVPCWATSSGPRRSTRLHGLGPVTLLLHGRRMAPRRWRIRPMRFPAAVRSRRHMARSRSLNGGLKRAKRCFCCMG